MRFSHLISTIDSHTGGNPTRTVVSGLPRLQGSTMAEKMMYMRAHHDWLRTALVFEPRGHDVMSGCVLTEPCDPRADVGVVFIETGGYLAMCGHDTIGLCTALVEAGMVPVSEPVTTIRLDTPAGLVEARVDVAGGKAGWVTFANVPAFLQMPNVQVDVPGRGRVTGDVAYGGLYYFITPAGPLDLELIPKNAAEIVRTGVAIRTAFNQQHMLQHPELAFMQGLTHVEFYAHPTRAEATVRNAVVIPPGGVDRSPCGTGTTAKVATLVARGELAIGQEFIHESITGSLFRARAVASLTVADFPGVRVEISGRAWITGFHQFVIDPEDELRTGFLLT